MPRRAARRWLAVAGLVAAFGLLQLGRFLARRRRLRLPFYQLTGEIAAAAQRRAASAVVERVRASGLVLLRLRGAQPAAEAPWRKLDPYTAPYSEGEYITELGPTHRLLSDRVPFHAAQLAVAAVEDEPPWAELTESDFLWGFLVAAAVDGICFHGSDRTAGAVHPNKALHVVAGVDTPTLRRLRAGARRARPTGDALADENVVALPALAPFRAVCVALRPCNRAADPALRAQYLKRVYHLCKRRLGADGLPAPFNLLFTDRWMLVALRKSHCAAAVPVDALGLLGSANVAEQEQLWRLRGLGLVGLLGEVLVGRGEPPAAVFSTRFA